MLTNRQKLILKEIIETVIENNRPVGSHELTEKPYLNFSSATIRSDMADLEKAGYLLKKHTSGGRIPSDHGYKYYIYNLFTRDEEINEFFPIIDKIIDDNAHQKLLAIEKVIKWLSDITNTTAFTIGAEDNEMTLIHINLTQINDYSAVLLFVTNTGNVHSKVIDLLGLPYLILETITKTLNNYLHGRTISEAINIFRSKEIDNLIFSGQGIDKKVIKEIFVDSLLQLNKESLKLHGINNIYKNLGIDDFDLLDDYQKKVNEKNLISLLAGGETLSVKLGKDIPFLPNTNCIILSTPYQAMGEQSGRLAVIGSKRMNFKKVIPLLEYVALKLSDLYEEEEDTWVQII